MGPVFFATFSTNLHPASDEKSDYDIERTVSEITKTQVSQAREQAARARFNCSYSDHGYHA